MKLFVVCRMCSWTAYKLFVICSWTAYKASGGHCVVPALNNVTHWGISGDYWRFLLDAVAKRVMGANRAF